MYKVVGKTLPIHDIKEKITGRAVYAGDMSLPRMLHVKLITSTIASGKVISMDIEEALKVDGVVRIVTYDDVDTEKYNSHVWFSGGKSVDDETIFTDEPKLVGDRIGAVLATSKLAAEKAAKLIKIEYEEYDALIDSHKALEKNGAAFKKEISVGDVKSLDGNPDLIKVESTFKTQKVHHTAMETHVAVAAPEGKDGLTVWAPCQVAYQVRLTISTVLDMPLNKVRVIKTTMGGSFGGKGQPILEVVVAFLAKLVGRPVKLAMSRQETIVGSRCRNGSIGNVKTYMTKEGKIVGRDVDMLIDAGAYYTNADAVAVAMGKKTFRMYDIEHQDYRGQSVLTNSPVGGACRGYGSPQVHAVTEVNIDNAARVLGMNPVDFRLKNMVEPFAKDPTGGPDLGNARAKDCIEEGRKAFNFDERWKNTTDDGRYIRAVGVASATHGNGYYNAFQDYITMYIRMEEDGGVHVNAALHDQGCGTITSMQMIIAEVLDMPVESIIIPEVDTGRSVYDSSGTQASRVTYVAGNCARKTAEKVREDLIKKAAIVMEIAEEDVVFEGGQVYDSNKPENKVPLGEMIIDIQNKLNYDVSATHTHKSNGNPAVYAINFAEVEIDKLTGLVRVTDALAVHDIGQAINRGMVIAQIQGAIQMGIGYALTEEIKIKPNGQIVGDSLAKYHVINTPDMPDVEVLLIEDGEESGPFGAKSVGEISTCAMAPAIVNAINHGLGVEIDQMPVTPERLIQILG